MCHSAVSDGEYFFIVILIIQTIIQKYFYFVVVQLNLFICIKIGTICVPLANIQENIGYILVFKAIIK